MPVCPACGSRAYAASSAMHEAGDDRVACGKCGRLYQSRAIGDYRHHDAYTASRVRCAVMYSDLQTGPLQACTLPIGHAGRHDDDDTV